MVPDTKIKTILTGNRPNTIGFTNMRCSESYKPRALSDYEKKKIAERIALRAEITRISLLDYEI